MRSQLLLGSGIAAAVVLLATACSSGGSASGSSGSASPTPSGSASASGSPSALATDAAATDIAQRFGCKVTDSTTQSSQSVAASNSTNPTGGLAVPTDATIVRCDRQALSFDIASYENAAGKQKTLDLLNGFVQLSKAQYSYCDGGLWIVTTDLDIKDKPTAAQEQKLKNGAQVAHQQLGCAVTNLG